MAALGPETKNDAKYVTAGVPKVTGAFFRAPVTTTAPKDATTALDPAFKNLGYISEDGFTHAEAVETAQVKSWGGDTVLNSQTGSSVTFSLTLMETMNPEVQKLIHGDKNVTGDPETNMVVKGTGEEHPEEMFVLEQILKGGIIKRTVYPRASISEIGEVTYKGGEAAGYAITFAATKDADGNYFYDYYGKGK